MKDTACIQYVLLPQYYSDGGMTNNLVTFSSGRTVTVSPFSGNQDICPRDVRASGRNVHVKNQTFNVSKENRQRVIHALFPPKLDALLRYYDNGYRDAERFIDKEKLR